ncbi:addiction module antidote protein, HigA family [Rouxiella silvae]|uniref:Addiction module antidote protein, HigA family n=1 Tax=Rouxiella silvae TaxID=1646373 RepID=A0ABX3TTV8_9GAMM|nr:HigA family addiction module antitoxin [Rouxiella silvae]ORJ18641.1 addiction module antidote protein, HigA family [Rouxiella silvae]
MDTRTAEPTSVGEIILEEFLKPMDYTQAQLAKALNISPKVLRQIIHGTRRVSVEEATELAALFEMPEDFFINVQAQHDRWEARMLTAQHHYRPINMVLAAG